MRNRIKRIVCVASSDVTRVSEEARLLERKRLRAEQLAAFKIRKESMGLWSKDLYYYLCQYGISETKCLIIAKFRAHYYRLLISKGVKCNFFSMFPHLFDVETAVRIYNAYLRHVYTDYDDVCESLEGRVDDRAIRYSIWSEKDPDDYAWYINKCIRIRGCF